jgi:putative nucleotidyltransferase with HDIG domain
MRLTFRKKNKRIAERKTETPLHRRIHPKPIGIALLLWFITILLFFGSGVVPEINLVEGQKAPATLVASIPFNCENLSETSFARSKAAAAVAPVFRIDPAPAQRALQHITTLTSRLTDYHNVSTNQQSQLEQSIQDLLIGTDLTAQQLLNACPLNQLEAFQQNMSNTLQNVMQIGILSDEIRMTLFQGQTTRKLTLVSDTENQTVALHQILSLQQAQNQFTATFKKDKCHAIAPLIAKRLIQPNLTYDDTLTTQSRQDATQSIKPIIQSYPIGTLLVRAGEPVTPQTLLLLQAHARQLLEEKDLTERRLEAVGQSILLLAALIATAILLRLVSPTLIHQTDKLILLTLLSLFTLGFARLLTYLSLQTTLIPSSTLIYLMPHAFAVLMAAILLNGSAALALGFWTSLATAIYFDQSFIVFSLGIFTTVTATTAARNVHRRSSLYKAGAWVAAINILFAGITAILHRPTLSILTGQLLSALLSAALATILTLLLIPLFEKCFRITTDITLLELSDMGHPLLQKMAIQAPGTYHHSLMVATLAQNAAETIGANSLLVRVCAYYHDIGKMAKPEFFAENIQENNNPHDDLSPHMSALVIISHVKEGLALAKRHKLPTPILDAIEQHHGNGLIHFFYNKAKEQLEKSNNTETLNEADFRYGGAPARTPEMAILSLTDAVEAASRSIKKPTPQKIANLVNDIFSIKLRDGQLDYAQLTMAQINTIKDSLIFSLSNMLHGRVAYSTDEDTAPQPPN